MMALDNHFVFTHQPCLHNWDQHLHAIENHATESPMSSSEASTGYLQDAVLDWSERSKRRRIISSTLHNSMDMTDDLHDIFQGFWDSSCFEDPLENLNLVLQDDIFNLDDPFKVLMDTKTQFLCTATATQQPLSCSSASSSYDEAEPPHSKDVDQTDENKSKDSIYSTLGLDGKATTFKDVESEGIELHNLKKKKKAMGVVYPFAVVKPGGFDGDVTLNDINSRILMRPSRPVRHPVGEFACSPCVYADGLGPSGKQVVSLTRIQTSGGRGTITIIRTKG